MNLYKDLIKDMGLNPCIDNCKYCQVGHAFCTENEEFEGIYWFYETDEFIIEIHDFFIKKERVVASFPHIGNLISFYSSYLITANGESFNPYETLFSNSLYVIDTSAAQQNYKFLLHGNFPYLSVGIGFKKKMIKEHLSCIKNKKNVNFSNVFFETKSLISTAIEKLALSILNCKMTSPAAEMFFEAKAKEWLSITINAFLSKKNKKIPYDDNIAIENVAHYLDDHYALDVPQEILEKIAMMSGTKLKKLFKQKYQMTITEYSQRKRMNIAETLLLNTSLEIKDVAKSVGYSSHSKFTTYYKKYKGICPKDVRDIAKKHKDYLPRSCNTKFRDLDK